MNYSPKAGLEPLYHETNRSISDTHAALAQLNNYVNYGPSPQNVNTRKIETSINTIIRYYLNSNFIFFGHWKKTVGIKFSIRLISSLQIIVTVTGLMFLCQNYLPVGPEEGEKTGKLKLIK